MVVKESGCDTHIHTPPLFFWMPSHKTLIIIIPAVKYTRPYKLQTQNTLQPVISTSSSAGKLSCAILNSRCTYPNCFLLLPSIATPSSSSASFKITFARLTFLAAIRSFPARGEVLCVRGKSAESKVEEGTV